MGSQPIDFNITVPGTVLELQKEPVIRGSEHVLAAERGELDYAWRRPSIVVVEIVASLVRKAPVIDEVEDNGA